MYRNLDECLYDIYRFGALRIEPMGNTAQICLWLESKGAGISKSGLTQAEWHANARLIQNRIERILNRYELAAIEMQYSEFDRHNIIDLSAYVLARYSRLEPLLCDKLISHLFTEIPRLVDIQDSLDLPKMTVWRWQQKVNGCVIGLLNQARFKADAELRAAGVVGSVKIA